MAAGDRGGGRRHLGPLVDQGGVRHTLSRRQATGLAAVGRSRRSAEPTKKPGSSSPAVRSRAINGLPSLPAGRAGPPPAPGSGDHPARPRPARQGPAQVDRLRQRLREGWGEAQDAPAPREEVEARRCHGRAWPGDVPAGQLDPGAQQHPWNARSKAGGQDDRVAQGALAQEHGSCSLCTGPGRLRPQPGRVLGLEEPVLPRRGRLGRPGISHGVGSSEPLPPSSDVVDQAGLGQPLQAAAQLRQVDPGHPDQLVQGGGVSGQGVVDQAVHALRTL